jgi:hypothetical protein
VNGVRLACTPRELVRLSRSQARSAVSTFWALVVFPLAGRQFDLHRLEVVVRGLRQQMGDAVKLRFQVHAAELPALDWVMHALLEAHLPPN